MTAPGERTDDAVIADVRGALAEIVADESVPFPDRLAARRGVAMVDALTFAEAPGDR